MEMQASVHIKTSMYVFIADLFIIAPNWKKNLNVLQHIHTVEYYLVIKRNELLIYSICMNLKQLEMTKSLKKLDITWFHYVIHLKQQNCRDSEQITGRQGLRIGVSG